MKKTFTVHAVHHKEVSPGKGSIIWLLSDEKGLPRKITAITDIDDKGVIDNMQAVYKREIPLVERLHSSEKGESFTIDFSIYNQQQNYAPREAYNNMRTQEKAAGFGAIATKAALAVGALAAVWFTYAAVSDVSQMSLKLMQ
ncbi:MAG: hypothetical protein ACPGSM_04455 [Thiolinea sp.]